MIMNDYYLSPAGQSLVKRLRELEAQAQQLQSHPHHESTVSVAGVGKTVSTAYEQLRNAAEYTEEHLLLQRAIRRFYTRSISFYDKKLQSDIAEELIIELTQSGYLRNNSISKQLLKDVEKLVKDYYEAYWQLRDERVSQEVASRWILDIVSVSTEGLFHFIDVHRTEICADFAFDHYYTLLKKDFDGKIEQYDMALFIAVHRSLLKSDQATVRAALLSREQNRKHSFKNLQEFSDFNQQIDDLFSASSTDRLVRYINKYGAPLRILNRLLHEETDASILENRTSFLHAFEAQTEREYRRVEKKINRGVIKSIIFLFITKVIVGIAIEIPYDLYFHDKIIWLPLIINLLFPPLFMASLRLSMKLPKRANTDALREYIDATFYQETPEARSLIIKPKNTAHSPLLNTMYIAMFLIIFSAVALRLWLWDFSLVHILIFFIFLSTASFLGFRLSRLIRELEMVNTNQGAVAVIRDFAYTPFILVGSWISDKYSRINVVALVLDMAIELPLKTFLKLLRQWTQFLSDKRDEL